MKRIVLLGVVALAACSPKHDAEPPKVGVASVAAPVASAMAANTMDCAGPVGASDTAKALKVKFGADAQTSKIPGPEGTVLHGISLYKADPKRHIDVVYWDAAMEHVSDVAPAGEGSTWAGHQAFETVVRLKDIAAAAQVSVMTVSKVLHDAPDISKATKERVRQMARQMGYMPDPAAQSLRNGSTHLLGLIISTVTNPIFARIMLAIEEHAHEAGFDVVVAHSLNNPEREASVIRRMVARRVDGLFISPVYRMSPKAQIYEELAGWKTPVVLLGHRAPFCANFANVETEDILASQAATHYLISLGHKRIAFFSGNPVSPASQERLEGYKRALRGAGLPVDDSLVFNAGSSIEEGQATALQLLNEKEPFTAIQAANDLVAVGAGSVLLQQGIKIPDDVSLMGFGNILLSEHFRIPLSTVRQPKFRLGVAAMESMKKLLAGEIPNTTRLNAEVIPRESTGRARILPG